MFVATNYPIRGGPGTQTCTQRCAHPKIPHQEKDAYLRSGIVALAYSEPGENGRSATIARIKSSKGKIKDQGRVVFADTFDGDGVVADVVYQLGSSSSFLAQDVIIRGRLPGPEYYGLGTNSFLMVITEFYDPPDPAMFAGVNDQGDVGLRWGPMTMSHGKAFGVGDEKRSRRRRSKGLDPAGRPLVPAGDGP
jgi:hypothetical protein